MLTNYQLQEILSKYDNYSLALSKTEPTKTGSNFTEPEGMGYSRLPLQNCLGSIQTGDEVYRQNVKEMHFMEATGDWGVIPWFGIFSGSNLMYFGKILNQEGQEEAIHPVANHIAIIRNGQLKISLKSEEE